MAGQKPLKIGVRIGSISPFGARYVWNVAIDDRAFDEAIDAVGESGYAHFEEQVKQLATEESPSHSNVVDVKAIDEIFEIRDHGGPMGNMNIRVFFGLDQTRKTIVVLCTIKKQNNGPTPIPDKNRARLRWNRYLRGDIGFIQ